MDLTERMARAMLASLRPAPYEDPRSIDVDETDIDFVELAQIALDEVIKGAESCGVCGCAVYRGLPNRVPPRS